MPCLRQGLGQADEVRDHVVHAGEYENHSGPIWSVAASADRRTLVSAGADGVRAWHLPNGGMQAHHDGEIVRLTAAPVRAFPGKMAGQAPATRKRERAAVVAFCKWAVRHKLLEASPMDRIDAIEVPGTLPGRRRTSSLARHRYRCTGRQSGEA